MTELLQARLDGVELPSTPPRSPLSMPAQDLRRHNRVRQAAQSARTGFARAIAFGGAAILSVVAAIHMRAAFGAAPLEPLEYALFGLFMTVFAWIAFSATSALSGMLAAPKRPAIDRSRPVTSRTAIVMPIYNEDVTDSFGALLALSKALAANGQSDAFEMFLLSDTRDENIAAQERAGLALLRSELGEAMPVWYRRRARNVSRKAGNIQDFVENWGDRYDFMVVLDADSVMAAETLVEMVRRMEAAPRLGLLQSTPMLVGGETMFARSQQFASLVYGRVLARGVAAWQGEDGNFWGHNAIIRLKAFADSAGLPELRGGAPFGGHILSHDFVEAALLRRAGWQIRMDPDLEGSWEGVPPNLLASAARDRRWAQGNLQHLKVIGSRGLRWPNRVHFVLGIGSYVMAPIWFCLLALGLILDAHTIATTPDPNSVFAAAFYAFVPEPDRERMMGLFAAAMALLTFPRIVGVAEILANRQERRSFGGAGGVIGSAVTEILVSSLIAPILMLFHCRQIVEILSGKDGGWSAQQRKGPSLGLAAAFNAHRGQFAAGVFLAVGLCLVSVGAMVWLVPFVAGLLAAPWLSWAVANDRIGRKVRDLGLFETPFERLQPGMLFAARVEGERMRMQLGALGWRGTVAPAPQSPQAQGDGQVAVQPA